MKPDALAMVVTRNTLLLVLFFFTLYPLHPLSQGGPATLSEGRRPPGTPRA
jgi:hypothetical protein